MKSLSFKNLFAKHSGSTARGVAVWALLLSAAERSHAPPVPLDISHILAVRICP